MKKITLPLLLGAIAALLLLSPTVRGQTQPPPPPPPPTFTPTATVLPTATPTATPTPLPPPQPVIMKVQLLHHVKGKLKTTKALHVGEKGRFAVFWSASNPSQPSSGATGDLLITKSGKALYHGAMRAASAGEFSLGLRFRSRSAIGKLVAQFTVTLGEARATRQLKFQVTA